MAVLTSRVNERSEDYQAQRGAHAGAGRRPHGAGVDDPARRADRSARERHVERGKLLPRDRIDALLDPDSPFLEIGQFAAHEVYGDDIPAAGVDRRRRPRQWAGRA
jgi:3-methylcrotonyl-CoA carboxylase beta subunit